MSKIRLHGSSSGYMEIAPPAAGSSETITLPNSAGEVLLSDGSAASLTQIPAANIVGVCTSGLTKTGGFGAILQLVSASQTSNFSTSSTSFVDVTNATLNITPTSSSSKIFVIMSGGRFGMFSNSAYASQVQVLRDSTVIARTEPTDRGTNSNGNTRGSSAISKLDEPSTTSQITYKVQARVIGGSGTIDVVGSGTGDVLIITAMEVAA